MLDYRDCIVADDPAVRAKARRPKQIPRPGTDASVTGSA